MDHNNSNASSSTKTEEIIKEQAAVQENLVAAMIMPPHPLLPAAVRSTPTVQKLTARNSSTV